MKKILAEQRAGCEPVLAISLLRCAAGIRSAIRRGTNGAPPGLRPPSPNGAFAALQRNLEREGVIGTEMGDGREHATIILNKCSIVKRRELASLAWRSIGVSPSCPGQKTPAKQRISLGVIGSYFWGGLARWRHAAWKSSSGRRAGPAVRNAQITRNPEVAKGSMAPLRGLPASACLRVFDQVSADTEFQLGEYGWLNKQRARDSEALARARCPGVGIPVSRWKLDHHAAIFAYI